MSYWSSVCSVCHLSYTALPTKSEGNLLYAVFVFCVFCKEIIQSAGSLDRLIVIFFCYRFEWHYRWWGTSRNFINKSLSKRWYRIAVLLISTQYWRQWRYWYSIDPSGLQLRGPGFRPGRVDMFCSWVNTFLSHCLSTQEYKWIPTNCQGSLMTFREGGNLVMD